MTGAKELGRASVRPPLLPVLLLLAQISKSLEVSQLVQGLPKMI